MAGNLKLSTVAEVPNNYAKAWSYRKTPRKPFRPRFMVWDGEGMDVSGWHEYVYLCGYDGVKFYEHPEPEGMGTETAFQRVLSAAKLKPELVHVIYGGSYDFNMMLRDVPMIRLLRLWTLGKVRWKNYRIELVPRKSLVISDGKITVTLWDVIGFFQTSFMKTLGINEDDGSITGKGWPVDLTVTEALTIWEGKKQRGSFTAGMRKPMEHYCQTELRVFYRLMVVLEEAVHAAGIHLTRWDGAGAVGGAYMRANKMKAFMHDDDYQSDWYRLVCSAYAGGHIELPQPGDHIGDIFHADVNSAYPSAIIGLPNLAMARYEKCDDKDCVVGDNDLAFVEYYGPDFAVMHPFFHRSYDGSICYPQHVRNWYWGIEVNAVIESGLDWCVNVGKHFHYINESDEKPFSWIGAEYAKREIYKRDKDPREKILKLGLNSIYGRTAQQAGWQPGRKVPQWHQLEWAGLITAFTRAKIWCAISANLDSVIALETDGIYATTPLPINIGTGLGNWDAETLSRLTYVQSGVYFAQHGNEITPRFRGIDPGALTRSKLLHAWEAMEIGGPNTLKLPSTRFRTLGGSLVSEERFKLWRQWVTDHREISLVPVGKRIHAFDCHNRWGEGLTHRTISVQPKPDSYAFAVSWVNTEEAKRHKALELELAQEREDADDELGIM